MILKNYTPGFAASVEDGPFKMAWIGLIDPDSKIVNPIASYDDTCGYHDGLIIYAADVPEGRGHTGKAVFEGKYSKKMSTLIDDLLAFSHIGRKEMQKREVNLNTLVSGVIQEIQEESKERQIRWQIDELPVVLGDHSLLRLAIVNLISNAVKFTNTRPQAEIKIGCKDDGDKFTCSIADNGVGVDMKYMGKLFGVFQGLHTQKEFEGTGNGLANVQRIIFRHGGRVWAEGAVGQGATFHFTLPKTRKA